MSRQREKEIEAKLAESSNSETLRLVNEFFSLRLARYKESLVGANNDSTRGRAQEARDIVKILNDGY